MLTRARMLSVAFVHMESHEEVAHAYPLKPEFSKGLFSSGLRSMFALVVVVVVVVVVVLLLLLLLPVYSLNEYVLSGLPRYCQLLLF